MFRKHEQHRLIFIAIALNMLVSFIVTLKHQPISVDGILYLKSAKVYLELGIGAATKIYPWPFYSILIGILSKILHLSLLHTAILLNVIFSSIIVVYFVLLTSTISANIKNQYWALAIILLCPFLNHERINILRDMGYYAFFLVSLYYFIRFLELNSNRQAILWQISLIIATVFRIEGLFLYFFSPIITKRNIFKLYSIAFILIILTVIFFHSILHYGRIPELLGYFNPISYIQEFKSRIAQQKLTLGTIGQDNALQYMLGGLAAIFISNFIQCLGVISALIVIYCFINIKKFSIPHYVLSGIICYVFIVFVVLGCFVFKQFFITERYLFPLVVLFMLFIPLGLSLLWKENKIIYKIGILLYLTLNAVSSFGQFGTSKSFIIDAGKWISDNTSESATLFTNDPLIAFYSQRNGTEYPKNFKNNHLQMNKPTTAVSYNYAALRIKHDDQRNIINDNFTLLKSFSNNKNDKILIYSIDKPARMERQ